MRGARRRLTGVEVAACRVPRMPICGRWLRTIYINMIVLYFESPDKRARATMSGHVMYARFISYARGTAAREGLLCGLSEGGTSGWLVGSRTGVGSC